jgi:plasmid stability protein
MRVELPDDLIEDIRSRAEQEGREIEETVADLLRTGLEQSSNRQTLTRVDASVLERRTAVAEKFLSGEWGVDLTGFREGRVADRDSATDRDRAWRR